MTQQLLEAAKQALNTLDNLSMLGNGNKVGNSHGNLIAKREADALRAAIQAAQAQPQTLSDDMRDRLVAISDAIANQDDRAAQKMISEILAAPQPQAAPKVPTRVCNPHPKAPHGFNRNRSHDAGEYVCDC